MLLINRGAGKFAVAATAGLTEEDWSISASFVDYDRDGENGELEWDPEAAFEPYAKKYDGRLQTWVALPERLGPRPVDFAAATAANEFLYLLGGCHFQAAVGVTQRYNSHSNAWDLLSPMPRARFCSVAATC